MATHSSVLAWRIPGMGSHRVRHDRSDLAAAVAGIEDRAITGVINPLIKKRHQGASLLLSPCKVTTKRQMSVSQEAVSHQIPNLPIS